MTTNVLDFGAKADGITLCTTAIQNAIDTCFSSGGGRVTVPAGTYRSGTIWLKSGIELHLEHGAVIKGSDSLDDYNEEDAYEQNFSSRENEKWLGKHLIIAHECENVAVTGTGALDGNGDFFLGEAGPKGVFVWKEGYRTAKDETLCRPGQLLCFIECKYVTVETITIQNQPCWGCFLHGCENAVVRGLKTKNPPDFFNSDGIDVDCCKNVVISDCIIDTGDDGIAIRASGARLKKSDGICEHIVVTGCVIGSSSSAFRIGVGNGTIRHVRVSNVCINRGAPAINFMSSYFGWGNTNIEDVSFSHISIANCSRPFELTNCSPENAHIRNVVVQDVRAEIYGFIQFDVAEEDTVENVVLRNWDVELIATPPITPKSEKRRKTAWFSAKRVNRLTLDQFAICDKGNHLAFWEGGLFSLENCKNETLRGVTLNNQEVLI